MRKAVLLALATIGLAACPGSPPQPTPNPGVVTIWSREPFDWTSYYDASGDSIYTANGDLIPYIAITCITNQSNTTFNFNPANLLVYLGQFNGAPGPSEAIYRPLLTSSSPLFNGFGNQWQPPGSLGMGQAVVPPESNGVPGTFLAPASFTAVTAGVDNDPADQPGTSIPGNNNYVYWHTMKYCVAGLSQDPTQPPGTCANSAGLTVNFNIGLGQDNYPRYLYVAQTKDFNAAEVVSQPPLQNLSAPVCP